MKSIKKIVILFLFGFTTAWAGGEPPGSPTVKQRQDCELGVTKGMIKLNEANDAEAEALFKAAILQWQDCYLAHEQLAWLSEKRGDLKSAIDSLLKAKHSSPDDRWSFLNFHIGRLYIDLKSEDRAETYLKVALDQGAFPVQTNYLLGFLFYRQGRYLEAERYLFDALDQQKSDNLWAVDNETSQALHYYLGEIYARMGFDRYAVQQLQQAEVGDSSEVRRAAWRLHAGLNKVLRTFNLGLFHSYDSNVALISAGEPVPRELSGQSTHSLNLSSNFWMETAPARRWGLGGGTGLNWNFNLTNDLGWLDKLQITPGIWARYWNLKNWEIKLRYDFSQTRFGRFSYPAYENLHGPTLSFQLFPGSRWTYLGFYNLQLKSYPLETETVKTVNDRSGTAHVVGLRAALDSPNPKFRPWGQYTFTFNDAVGPNYDYTGHGLELGADSYLFLHTKGHGSVGYEWRQFPNALVARDDRILRARAGMMSALFGDFILSIEFSYIHALSAVSLFRYDRFQMATGVVFQF